MNKELQVMHQKIENHYKKVCNNESKKDQISEIEQIEESIKLAQYRIKSIISSGIEHF